MATVKEKRITEVIRDNFLYGTEGLAGLSMSATAITTDGAPPPRFDEWVTLDIERPRLYYQSYKANEGEPMVIRRGKAMAHLLDNRPLYIIPHERIVGNITSKPNQLATFPELWWR